MTKFGKIQSHTDGEETVGTRWQAAVAGVRDLSKAAKNVQHKLANRFVDRVFTVQASIPTAFLAASSRSVAE